MRWPSSRRIGKFLLLALFWLSFSSSAWSLDTISAPSAPVVASSASSPDGSTSPQTSKPSIPQLPAPPELPMVQPDSSLPISEQRRLALGEWTNFWKTQELPWRAQLQTWLAEVKASWMSQKALESKEAEDADKALKDKDDVITAQANEIATLKAESERLKHDWWLALFGGFIGGSVTTEGANLVLHH